MKRHLIIILFFLSTLFSFAKSPVTIKVRSGNYTRTNTVVKVDISSLNISEDENVVLYEVSDGKKAFCPSQIDCSEKVLMFILKGTTEKGTERTYILKKQKKNVPEIAMGIDDDGDNLTLKREGKSVLSYKYTITKAPEGVNEIFSRSGYIHPALTPSGFVLTTIQPKDHRHHYGIWNPWTKVEYRGNTYDLWNLGDGKGTVRAKEVLAKYQGSVMSGFDAALDHNIKNNGKEETIINEIWKVRAWNYDGQGYLWDFESTLTPSTDYPVLIKEYRYAGFGFRANKYWVKDNCEMISSEGHDRKSIDGTRGRWIYTIGQNGKSGRSGLLMMGYPQNYNYPEPLRIWDEKASYVFMNFAPTKNMDWNLESGHSYKLKYRLFAFDGEMTPEQAEALWIDFAYPPEVEVK